MAYYRLGDNFVSFVGRVVDIQDEYQLGRVKIRVIHDQTGELGSKEKRLGGVTDDDLLWAYPISSIQSASLHQSKINELEEFSVPEYIDAVGISPTGIAEGSYVFGFYLDGPEKNIPMIFGTYHKMSVFPEPVTDSTGSMLQKDRPQGEVSHFCDVAKIARGENSLPKKKSILGRVTEPDSAYKTVYPYNLTYTTKSGHAIEIDDTPNGERIHIYHKTGSYEEIDENGRRVTKSVQDSYDIGSNNHFFSYLTNQVGEIGIDQTVHVANTRYHETDNEDYQTIGNNQIVSIGHDQTITIGDNQTVNVGKNCTVTIGENCTINVGGNANITVSGDTNVQTGGSMTIQSGGSMNLTAGGAMSLSAPSIDLN